MRLTDFAVTRPALAGGRDRRPRRSPAGTRRAERHQSLAYRPAIDGLRAIAVVAVMIGHLDEQFLPGGWLGVDVFFVISGFLITSLLLRERTATGRVDLVGFWMARARRLLPALFLVLGAVLLAARFLGLPARREAVSGDVLSTILYVANWRMLFSDEAYFASIANPSPLRHAWSLAVEEQYYLIFPPLLLLLLTLVRSRNKLVLALGALAAASAVLMGILYTPGLEPARVYYGTDTRAFELLIGAVAGALVLRSNSGRDPAPIASRTDTIARTASPVALALVLLALVVGGTFPDVLFRGGLVVLCLLVALVVIAAASWEASTVQTVLAWEPLRRIGLISYGLYLWHWPVIVYVNQALPDTSTVVRIYVQVFLSFVLAVLSYVLVERPIRRHGLGVLLPRWPRLANGVGATTAAAVAVGAFALPVGATQAVTTAEVSSNLTFEAPPYQTGETVQDVLLVGNSIPASYERYYPDGMYPDLRVSGYTNPGCDLFPEPRYHGGTPDAVKSECTDWRQGLESALRTKDPDVVLVFVSQSLVSDRFVDGERLKASSPAFADYIADGLQDLKDVVDATGDRQMVLLNLACHRVPDFGVDEEVSRFNDDTKVARVNEMTADWAARADVPVIDQNAFLCGDGYHDGINGTPLYEDYLHVTTESGPEVWSWLAPRVQDAADGRLQGS